MKYPKNKSVAKIINASISFCIMLSPVVGNITSWGKPISKKPKDFIKKEIVVNIERTDESLYAELDSSALYEDTGWKPKYSMEDMVRSIFEYKLS